MDLSFPSFSFFILLSFGSCFDQEDSYKKNRFVRIVFPFFLSDFFPSSFTPLYPFSFTDIYKQLNSLFRVVQLKLGKFGDEKRRKKE